MTYSEAMAYLYAQLPVFHRIGAKAIKPGLDNIRRLCEHLGNPQEKLTCIHVAGTNGKGSSSHLLAAVLQSAGYRTGLYTSPHLKSFTERIRVDGVEMVSEAVAAFVTQHRAFIDDLQPSFFEVTVALAFDYFARQEVDVAVIEVGLGGRLDSTNVITPIVSLITNIGWDHTDILGDTLPAIAAEKAGIIKPSVPVVVSERDPETEAVFIRKAAECQSPILFASDRYQLVDEGVEPGGRRMRIVSQPNDRGTLVVGLQGIYQLKNAAGVLATLDCLNEMFPIPWSAVEEGFREVGSLTGLKGRWQVLQQNPLVICDTAHNRPGLEQVFESVRNIPFHHLHIVTGFVKDKDLSRVVELFPKDAFYYFCQPDIPRALDAESLAELFKQTGRIGVVHPDVNEAFRVALDAAAPADCVLITGSTYVVAELNQL